MEMVVLGAVASSGSPPSEGGRGGRDLGLTRGYCGLWDHELEKQDLAQAEMRSDHLLQALIDDCESGIVRLTTWG